MELSRTDGSHTVQFRDGNEAGTAAAAAVAKLAVHAEEDYARRLPIDAHHQANREYMKRHARCGSHANEHVIAARVHEASICDDQGKIRASSDGDCL